MTDSGQPPKPMQSVPPWAPAPDPKDAPHPAPPPADLAATMRLIPIPPPTTIPPPADADATMRLIPVPPPTAPPPPVAAITTPPQVPGERYIGKYRVKGELGRGGMGAVYLAEQPGLGREVAIKKLIQSADPLPLTRFLPHTP